MHQSTHTQDVSCAELYVSQIETLREEIVAAVASIAANDSEGVQESVARQEFLAAGLARLFWRVKNETAPSLTVDDRTRILRSAGRLQQTAQGYAALLQHSGSSIAVLASLCRSHTLPATEVRGARPARQTWSCEM